MSHHKWVRYHSPEWQRMVEGGWVTAIVQDGMALLILTTKV